MKLIGAISALVVLMSISAAAETEIMQEFLWVPCFLSNNVYKINTSTHQVTAIIPVGSGPAGIAVGPNIVYVTCRYSSKLYCISRAIDIVTDSISLSPEIAFGIGVALDSRDDIYVVGRRNLNSYDMDMARLVKIGQDGTILGSIDLCQIQANADLGSWFNMGVIGIAIKEPEIMIPWQRSWDVNTGIILTDTNMTNITDMQFDPHVYGYRGPGAAYDNSDRGWSSGVRVGQNFLISHWNGDSWQYRDMGDWICNPGIYGDLAVDNYGNIWTGNMAGYLVKYNPRTDQITPIVLSGQEIKGIAVDNRRLIWVALYPLNAMVQFDLNGNIIGDTVRVGEMPMGFGDMTGHEYGKRMTVIDDEPISPNTISLLSAFPNPFNATTQFFYSVVDAGPVTIDIYSLLGQKVASINDNIAKTGEHQIAWDASGFSSGIYFARLNSKTSTGGLKIILLK
jgi:YVTN family beta-propeller protein